MLSGNSFDALVENGYTKLDELYQNIEAGSPGTRIANLNSIANNAPNIRICAGFKTLEFELAVNNILSNRNDLNNNFLFQYLNTINPDKIARILEYTLSFEIDVLTDIQKKKVAILLWKSFPSKAEFAQDLSLHILNNLEQAKASFVVPPYILQGLNHLK